MALGRGKGTLVGILGAAVLYYGVAGGIASGSINIGNKHNAYFVTFSQQPGLFVAGLLFFLAVGVGCLAVAWQAWRREE